MPVPVTVPVPSPLRWTETTSVRRRKLGVTVVLAVSLKPHTSFVFPPVHAIPVQFTKLNPGSGEAKIWTFVP